MQNPPQDLANAGHNPQTEVGSDFDPMADRGTPPFETCDSTLRLAEEAGLGTRDLKRIEVVGTPIEQAMFRFRDHKGPGPQGVQDRPGRSRG